MVNKFRQVDRSHFRRYGSSADDSGLVTFVPVLSTHDLRKANSDVTNAVIGIHGLNEDAAGTFLSMLNALGNRTDTIVAVPWFHSTSVAGRQWGEQGESEDSWLIDEFPVPQNSLSWSANTSWIAGGDNDPTVPSTNASSHRISSYAVLDAFYTDLSRRELFPALRRVTYVGFSAGGQLVNRYAWATPLGTDLRTTTAKERNSRSEAETPALSSSSSSSDSSSGPSLPSEDTTAAPLSVRFIVSDASSYLYFNAVRPAPACRPMYDTGTKHACGKFMMYSQVVPYAQGDSQKQYGNSADAAASASPYSPIKLSITTCKEFDTWKYGTILPADMKEGYSYFRDLLDNPAAIAERTQLYRRKDVRYVFGAWDSCNCKSEAYVNPPHCLHSSVTDGTDESPRGSGSAPLVCTPSLYDITLTSAGGVDTTTCCDTYPDSRNNDLAVSCGSMLQGSNRLQRGVNYMEYLRFYYNTPISDGGGVLDTAGSNAKGGNSHGKFAPVYAMLAQVQHDSPSFYVSDIVEKWAFSVDAEPPVIPQPSRVRAGRTSSVSALVLAFFLLVVVVHALYSLVRFLVRRNRDAQRLREQDSTVVDETTHLL